MINRKKLIIIERLTRFITLSSKEVRKMGALTKIVGIVILLCGLLIMGGSVFFTPLNQLIGTYGGMAVGGVIAIIGLIIVLIG